MSHPSGPEWRLEILRKLIERVYGQLLECGPSSFARERELHKLLIPLLREYRMTANSRGEPETGISRGGEADESAPPPPPPEAPAPREASDGPIAALPEPPASRAGFPDSASGLEAAAPHPPDAAHTHPRYVSRRIIEVADQIMRESVQHKSRALPFNHRRHGKLRAP